MQWEHEMVKRKEDVSKIARSAPLSSVRNFISNLRFFPKTHDFFGYFEKSSHNIVAGAKLLCRMIENKDDRPELVKELKDYEHVGDKITHDVIDLLHQTFLTPFDRGDIHKLVVEMDDILDIIYYVGNRLTRYNVSEMPKEVLELAKIVLRSSEEISSAVGGMKDLKNMQKVLHHCIEINSLENEADEIVNTVIEELFGNNWEPLQIIKIKELVENLETTADKCEDVANTIENILLKHA